MENKRVPEIRFAEFTGDWEQLKFGKVFDVHTDFVSNGSFQSLKDNVKHYHTENYAYMIRLQDASNNWEGPWLYTDKKGFEFLDKSTVYENDILMSDRGTIGKFFLVPQLDKPMTLSSNAVLLRSSKNDNHFIYYMLNTKVVENQIKMRTTPGVQPMISKTQFKKITAKIPKINEQMKISNLFKQLDDMIAIHQQEIDTLKQTKRGFLQKLFPKDGESLPEIRFPGVAGDWKQRKLGDILKSHKFKLYLANPNEEGDFEVVQQGDKPVVGYANGSPFENYKDIILFGDHTVSLYKPRKPFFVATDGVKILSADQFNGQYLFTLLERYKPEPQGYRRHFTILKNQSCWITENKEEQEKIGNFFKQLDDTIALHEQEIETLKQTKKAFLQKMFV